MKGPIQLEEVVKTIQEEASREAEVILRMAVSNLTGQECDLEEVEKEVRCQILKLGGNILKQAFKVAGSGYHGSGVECECGEKKKFIGNREKVVTTLLGEMEVKRAYYYCEGCGSSWTPLDERYDIEDTGFSPGLREAISKVDAEVSFERGSLLLKDLLEVEISK